MHGNDVAFQIVLPGEKRKQCIHPSSSIRVTRAHLADRRSITKSREPPDPPVREISALFAMELFLFVVAVVNVDVVFDFAVFVVGRFVTDGWKKKLSRGELKT